MKDIYKKATISHTDVDELYERKLSAEIDGANGLIYLTRTETRYDNGVAGEEVKKNIHLSFDELRRLNITMAELEAL